MLGITRLGELVSLHFLNNVSASRLVMLIRETAAFFVCRECAYFSHMKCVKYILNSSYCISIQEPCISKRTETIRLHAQWYHQFGRQDRVHGYHRQHIPCWRIFNLAYFPCGPGGQGLCLVALRSSAFC